MIGFQMIIFGGLSVVTTVHRHKYYRYISPWRHLDYVDSYYMSHEAFFDSKYRNYAGLLIDFLLKFLVLFSNNANSPKSRMFALQENLAFENQS